MAGAGEIGRNAKNCSMNALGEFFCLFACLFCCGQLFFVFIWGGGGSNLFAAVLLMFAQDCCSLFHVGIDVLVQFSLLFSFL